MGCKVEMAMNMIVVLFLSLLDFFVVMAQNIAIQLVSEDYDVPESQYEKVFLANTSEQSPISTSSLEQLKSGLQDYVLKHGNNLSSKCNSCFTSWEELKVGSGVACCTINRLHTELVMEAVVVINNMSIQNTMCFREYGDKTEVLYFKDFSPCVMSQSSMKALKSIDWKGYGLHLRGIVELDGIALLEWENLPTDTHIDIVLHSYLKQPRKMTQLDRSLLKRAVKISLDDLKAKHSGDFLSSRAVQIRNHAPDLAQTIAGLILSSSELDFQRECFSILKSNSLELLSHCTSGTRVYLVFSFSYVLMLLV
ncbi:hypothetical protein P8452_41647 [Trifolium repens]|nr:hypothetical protein P8452_41647 [Trifolium repens]